MAQEEEAAGQYAATDGASPVPSLVTLCLQAIGRHLKHFCNLRLHDAAYKELSATERQLIQAYDLSRLDVFEAQGFLPFIAAWRSQAQSKKAKAFRAHSIYRIHPSEIPRAHALPAYVLLPLASQQSGDPLSSLKTALGFEQVLQTDLRVTETPASAPQGRLEWFSGVIEDTTDSQMSSELASKLNVESPEVKSPSDTSKTLPGMDEIIRFRSPVTNVGCGILASLLRRSGTLVQLRLNSCQITDSGAVLLASVMRTTSTLRLFDLSNDRFPSRRDLPMDNVIGSVGARSIALALELNRSVEYVCAGAS